MIRRLRAIVLLVAVVAAACSLPTDESAQVIDQERLDDALQREPTTTTSTTLPVRTRDFAFFLLVESGEGGVREVLQVPAVVPDASYAEILTPMSAEGFTEEIGADPDTTINQVRQYTLADVQVDPQSGIATVFLQTDPEQELPGQTDLRDVAAQLVWTLTGEEGIDSILINIDETLQSIPTTNEAQNLTDDPVTIDDFESYNPEIEPASTTTEPPDETTTTSTTTTVPPDE
ncbi:MAG: hypothetical protein AAF548_12845 [Actinomycetota bacterium]